MTPWSAIGSGTYEMTQAGSCCWLSEAPLRLISQRPCLYQVVRVPIIDERLQVRLHGALLRFPRAHFAHQHFQFGVGLLPAGTVHLVAVLIHEQHVVNGRLVESLLLWFSQIRAIIHPHPLS